MTQLRITRNDGKHYIYDIPMGQVYEVRGDEVSVEVLAVFVK